MSATTNNNPADIYPDQPQNFSETIGRNFGLILGVLTAVYLVILNLMSGNGDIPTGLRFAKHLLIVPVVWLAVAAFAKRLPKGRKFKRELGLLLRIAVWTALVIAVINIAFFGIFGSSFEQFMQEGETFFGVMVNSGFLIFETVVFVMIIGFVILQAYKGAGSPEDE